MRQPIVNAAALIDAQIETLIDKAAELAAQRTIDRLVNLSGEQLERLFQLIAELAAAKLKAGL